MSVVYLQNIEVDTRPEKDNRHRAWVEPGQKLKAGDYLYLTFFFDRIDDVHRPYVNIIYPDVIKTHELIDGAWLDLQAYCGVVVFPRATAYRDGYPAALLLEFIHCRTADQDDTQPPAV